MCIGYSGLICLVMRAGHIKLFIVMRRVCIRQTRLITTGEHFLINFVLFFYLMTETLAKYREKYFHKLLDNQNNICYILSITN